jgi:hypothetical protein
MPIITRTTPAFINGDGHHREAARVPSRRRQTVGGRDQPFRLDRGRVDRGAGSGQPGGAEAIAQSALRTPRAVYDVPRVTSRLSS